MAIIPWSSEKYQPVGRCIYAQKGESHEGPFTDEHIIPFGLLPKGGDWFLPESSCLACNAITKKFEDTCLRSMMGVFRAKLDLKTRRKKQRSEPRDAIFSLPDGSPQVRQMKHGELPHYCIGFSWPAPGILRDQPEDSRDFDGKVVVRYPQGELEKFIPDQYGFKLGTIRMLDFARMLAKIAHSYAVAKYGSGAFDPLLLDFISGRTENASYLIGGDDSAMVQSQPSLMHDVYPIHCRTEPKHEEYLLVAIRLFAFLEMPRYLVAVGKNFKKNGLLPQQ
jgi:hypothetical protein